MGFQKANVPLGNGLFGELKTFPNYFGCVWNNLFNYSSHNGIVDARTTNADCEQMSKREAKREAKRHIYSCLATTLIADWENGSGYLCEMFSDDEDVSLGIYQGQKCTETDVKHLVDEIILKLQRKGRKINGKP